MKRKIIHIDEDKCNGCGACAAACHEGAIGMINGKAKLLRDDYCDAFGDCLPGCPTGAISFTEREAAPYDKAAVLAKKLGLAAGNIEPCKVPDACPMTGRKQPEPAANSGPEMVSELRQWPVQIKLAPVNAPYFENARLLVVASCTAYARADFHERFIKGHVTLIGCPKLDGVDYSEKLAEIIRENNIKNITVVRMEVPCCGGLVNAVKKALEASGKMIPWQTATISTDGEILD